MATTKPRINVTLSHDNYNMLKTYAASMGMTVSGLAAYFINQGIIGYNKINEAMARTPEVLNGQITIEQILAETGKEAMKNAIK